MRNLSGCGLATVHRHRGGFLRLEARPCPPDPPGPPDPSDPPDPPVPSALVGPGVLSWLAVTLPRVRYKILPAWCFVEQSGKNSPCAGKTRQIGPSWASGESFVPHMRREGVSRESFVPKRQGVVLVGRVVLCSGVVLVPVGGLWRRPGAAHGHCGRALRAPGVLHAGGGGGFALHEAFGRRVAGVSDPRVVQFPPTGGGADAVCGGVVPKSQTTSVKNTENGLLVAK